MFWSDKHNWETYHTITLNVNKETQKECTYALDGFICRGCLNLECYLCKQIEGLTSRGGLITQRGEALNARFYGIPVTPEMNWSLKL